MNLLTGLQLPSQKEWAAGVGGLLAFIVIAGLQHFGVTFGAEADAALDGALLVLLPAGVAKLVPPSDQDVLKHINDDIAQAGTMIGKLTPASDTGATLTPKAVSLALDSSDYHQV